MELSEFLELEAPTESSAHREQAGLSWQLLLHQASWQGKCFLGSDPRPAPLIPLESRSAQAPLLSEQLRAEARLLLPAFLSLERLTWQQDSC